MTIQNDDILLVNNGVSNKVRSDNLAEQSGILLVNRDGQSYKLSIANFSSKVMDDDLFLVNRGGQSYRVRGEEVKRLFNLAPAGATSQITATEYDSRGISLWNQSKNWIDEVTTAGNAPTDNYYVFDGKLNNYVVGNSGVWNNATYNFATPLPIEKDMVLYVTEAWGNSEFLSGVNNQQISSLTYTKFAYDGPSTPSFQSTAYRVSGLTELQSVQFSSTNGLVAIEVDGLMLVTPGLLGAPTIPLQTLTVESSTNLDTFVEGDGLRMVDNNGETAFYTPVSDSIVIADDRIVEIAFTTTPESEVSYTLNKPYQPFSIESKEAYDDLADNADVSALVYFYSAGARQTIEYQLFFIPTFLDDDDITLYFRKYNTESFDTGFIVDGVDIGSGRTSVITSIGDGYAKGKGWKFKGKDFPNNTISKLRYFEASYNGSAQFGLMGIAINGEWLADYPITDITLSGSQDLKYFIPGDVVQGQKVDPTQQEFCDTDFTDGTKWDGGNRIYPNAFDGRSDTYCSASVGTSITVTYPDDYWYIDGDLTMTKAGSINAASLVINGENKNAAFSAGTPVLSNDYVKTIQFNRTDSSSAIQWSTFNLNGVPIVAPIDDTVTVMSTDVDNNQITVTSGGNWFSPTDNSKMWSNNMTGFLNISGYPGYSPVGAFDGSKTSVTAFADEDDLGTEHVVTLNLPVTDNVKVICHNEQGSMTFKYTDDEGEHIFSPPRTINSDIGQGKLPTTTIYPVGNIVNLKVSGGHASPFEVYYGGFAQIYVDDVLLIDGPYNTTQTWSDDVTTGGTYYPGNEPSKAFNGIESERVGMYCSTNNAADNWISVDLSGKNLSGDIEVRAYAASGVYINGDNITGVSSAQTGGMPAWTTHTFPTQTSINRIYFPANSGDAPAFTTVTVNGQLLLDGQSDNSRVWSNSFNSSFNETTPKTNAFDGDPNSSVFAVIGVPMTLTFDPPYQVSSEVKQMNTGSNSGDKVIVTVDGVDQPQISIEEFKEETVLYTVTGAPVNINKIVWTESGDVGVSAVYMDGKMLIDAVTAEPEITGPAKSGRGDFLEWENKERTTSLIPVTDNITAVTNDSFVLTGQSNGNVYAGSYASTVDGNTNTGLNGNGATWNFSSPQSGLFSWYGNYNANQGANAARFTITTAGSTGDTIVTTGGSDVQQRNIGTFNDVTSITVEFTGQTGQYGSSFRALYLNNNILVAGTNYGTSTELVFESDKDLEYFEPGDLIQTIKTGDPPFLENIIQKGTVAYGFGYGTDGNTGSGWRCNPYSTILVRVSGSYNSYCTLRTNLGNGSTYIPASGRIIYINGRNASALLDPALGYDPAETNIDLAPFLGGEPLESIQFVNNSGVMSQSFNALWVNGSSTPGTGAVIVNTGTFVDHEVVSVDVSGSSMMVTGGEWGDGSGVPSDENQDATWSDRTVVTSGTPYSNGVPALFDGNAEGYGRGYGLENYGTGYVYVSTELPLEYDGSMGSTVNVAGGYNTSTDGNIELVFDTGATVIWSASGFAANSSSKQGPQNIPAGATKIVEIKVNGNSGNSVICTGIYVDDRLFVDGLSRRVTGPAKDVGTGVFDVEVELSNSNNQWIDNQNREGRSFFASTQTGLLDATRAQSITDYGVAANVAATFNSTGEIQVTPPTTYNLRRPTS